MKVITGELQHNLILILTEEAVRKINKLGRNLNNVSRHVRKLKIKVQMLFEEGACEEMMEHFILMRRIEQNLGKHICKKL